MLLILSIYSSPAHADKYDANSPVDWVAQVNEDGKENILKGKDFGEFISKPFINKKLKLKCNFDFKKGHTKTFKVGDDTGGGDYEETLSFRCKLGDINLTTKPVNCSKGAKKPISDNNFLSFGAPNISFKFNCSIYDSEDPK
jgi:hypothetical protein